MSECRSCGAPVVWARHPESGKLAPFDAAPGPGGQWVLHPKVVGAPPVAEFAPERESGFTSHFATCPNAESHRRGAA